MLSAAETPFGAHLLHDKDCSALQADTIVSLCWSAVQRDFAVYIKHKEVHCHQLLQASIPVQCDTRTEAAAAHPLHGYCTDGDDAENQDDENDIHLQNTLKELEAVWGKKFAWHRELAELSSCDDHEDLLKKHFRTVNMAGGFWHASQLKFLHMLMHVFGRLCKHNGSEVTSASYQVWSAASAHSERKPLIARYALILRSLHFLQQKLALLMYICATAHCLSLNGRWS